MRSHTEPGSGSVRTALLVLGAAAVILLVLSPPVAADPPAAPDTRTACEYGVYVRNLRDLDFQHANYYADIELWSVCSDRRYGGASTMSPSQVYDVAVTNESSVRPDGRFWEKKRFTGRFRKNWNTVDFPFDRQILAINFWASISTTGTVRLTLDPHSPIPKDAFPLEDFRVTEAKVIPMLAINKMPMGRTDVRPDGTYAPQQLNFAYLLITLQRTSRMPLVSLLSPLYAAVSTAGVTYLFARRSRSALLGRLALAGSCVLTIVLNVQTVHGQIGSSELTAMDQLQLTGLVYAVVAVMSVVHGWLQFTRGDPADRIRRFAHRTGVLSTLALITAHAVIVISAVHGTPDPTLYRTVPCPPVDIPGAFCYVHGDSRVGPLQ